MSGKEPRVDLTRDEDFYMQDVIFRVENQLFKVPIRYLIETSDVFRTMFELPQGEEASGGEGSSDEKPVHLEGVKSEDFKQLLKVLFASHYSNLDGLTLENWTTVLNLSSKWDMKIIRESAITKISSIIKDDPHTQLLWGQTQDIESWIFEGASSLVNRLDAMNEEDVRKLGLQTTLKIAKIREDMKNREMSEYQSLSNWLIRKTVNAKMAVKAEEKVRDVFEVPLRASS